jgi:2-C-methyl-D-erythritol 4-phosphate cytidylyltransferase
MGGGRSKPFVTIASRQILLRSLHPFERAPAVDAIVVVAAKRSVGEAKNLVAKNRLRKVVGVVEGGKERQDSVWNGLLALADERVDIVLIHDAARPFVDAGLIARVISAAATYGAAVPGIPVIDTVKSASKGGFVGSTIDRSKLRRIQTPQGFAFGPLMEVFRRAMKKREYGTDEAMLFERRGIPVRIVEGSPENIKITTPGDLHLADYYARRRPGRRNLS